MPTLFRFLIILCTMAALVFGAILALALFVVPRERDITVRIPQERLEPSTSTPENRTTGTVP